MVRIQLADIPVQMNNRFQNLETFCRGYETAREPLITLSVSPEELEQERKMQTGRFSDGYLETVCMYRKLAMLLLEHRVFIMHASVIEVDGRGYAFLASSGTGKTTQTRLWLEHFGSRARVINGDKPLIRMEREGDSWCFRAYGTPWCGKEGMNCNASVPLHALFFLERAKRPACTRAAQEQCIGRLFQQFLLPDKEEQMEQLLTMVDHLVETVPAYLLRCDMTADSVVAAFGAANPIDS